MEDIPFAIGIAASFRVDNVAARLTGEIFQVLCPESPRKLKSRCEGGVLKRAKVPVAGLSNIRSRGVQEHLRVMVQQERRNPSQHKKAPQHNPNLKTRQPELMAWRKTHWSRPSW